MGNGSGVSRGDRACAHGPDGCRRPEPPCAPKTRAHGVGRGARCADRRVAARWTSGATAATVVAAEGKVGGWAARSGWRQLR
jgi:hypothetical protein